MDTGYAARLRNDARSGRGLTFLLWLIGVALLLATPLLRDRVTLSDDLWVTSWLAPYWVFLQVCVLAAFLALARRRTEPWSQASRALFGLAAAVVIGLFQPETVTLLIAKDNVPLSADPLRATVLWGTLLAFYLVPALVVVGAWLRRTTPVSAWRALGIALVFIGIANYAFILWLGRLWEVYYTGPGQAV